MRFRLRPREARFVELLTAVAAALPPAAQVAAELLAAEPAQRGDLAARVRELDGAAHTAATGVVRELAGSFVTPLDRADLFRLAWALRDGVARIDGFVALGALVPDRQLPPECAELVQLLGHGCDVLTDAVPRLPRVEAAAPAFTELVRLRRQAGDVHRRGVVRLTADVVDAGALARALALLDGAVAAVAALEAVGHVLQLVVVAEG